MRDAIHVKGISQFRWDNCFEFLMALVCPLPIDPSQPSGDTMNVRVHRQYFRAKGIHRYALGNLQRDAGERGQICFRLSVFGLAQGRQFATLKVAPNLPERRADLL
jgi:hypothetical protein